MEMDSKLAGGTMDRECAICGESLAPNDDLGEMHDPENPEERGGIVHAECGISAGWEVS